MPDIKYYKDMSEKTYNELYIDTWDLKKQSLIYLEKDLISLYEIVKTSNITLHK